MADCYVHGINIVSDQLAGWDEGGSIGGVKHAVECQRLCQAQDGCKFFSYGMSDSKFVRSRRRCYFKTGRTEVLNGTKMVSGPKFC